MRAAKKKMSIHDDIELIDKPQTLNGIGLSKTELKNLLLGLSFVEYQEDIGNYKRDNKNYSKFISRLDTVVSNPQNKNALSDIYSMYKKLEAAGVKIIDRMAQMQAEIMQHVHLATDYGSSFLNMISGLTGDNERDVKQKIDAEISHYKISKSGVDIKGLTEDLITARRVGDARLLVWTSIVTMNYVDMPKEILAEMENEFNNAIITSATDVMTIIKSAALCDILNDDVDITVTCANQNTAEPKK